jgi:hypothetical protein
MGHEPNNLKEHTRIITPLVLKTKTCAYINEAEEDPNGKL